MILYVMRRVIYLITLLIVYYNAPDYELDVYEYETEEFEIEVTCAEGVTDCKEPKEEEQKQEIQTSRPYGSYNREFPYVFIY